MYGQGNWHDGIMHVANMLFKCVLCYTQLVMTQQIGPVRETIMETLFLLAGLAHTKISFGTATKTLPSKILQHFQAWLNTVVTTCECNIMTFGWTVQQCHLANPIKLNLIKVRRANCRLLTAARTIVVMFYNLQSIMCLINYN